MEAVSPVAKLRPLVALARQGPLSVAVALTTDEEAVLLLHKTASPKKTMTHLQAAVADAKAKLTASTVRFGLAHVDEAYDPKVLKIAVNKEAPGKLRLKLNQTVKSVALREVEFSVDPALDAEEAEAGEAEDAGSPAGQGSGADPATVKAELVAEITRLKAAGDAASEKAKALATHGLVALKAQDFAAAAEVTAKLRELLDAEMERAPGADNAEPARSSDYEKARQLWIGTLNVTHNSLAALTAAIKDAYEPEGMGDAVSAAFTARVTPAMNRLHVGLAEALQVLAGPGNAPQTAKLAEARKLAAAVRADVAATPLFALLDANPLTPVTINKMLTRALAAIEHALA